MGELSPPTIFRRGPPRTGVALFCIPPRGSPRRMRAPPFFVRPPGAGFRHVVRAPFLFVFWGEGCAPAGRAPLFFRFARLRRPAGGVRVLGRWNIERLSRQSWNAVSMELRARSRQDRRAHGSARLPDTPTPSCTELTSAASRDHRIETVEPARRPVPRARISCPCETYFRGRPPAQRGALRRGLRGHSAIPGDDRCSGRRLSFFETLTAMAFAAFAEPPWMSGGHRDNVGRQLRRDQRRQRRAVITPISLDHVRLSRPRRRDDRGGEGGHHQARSHSRDRAAGASRRPGAPMAEGATKWVPPWREGLEFGA